MTEDDFFFSVDDVSKNRLQYFYVSVKTKKPPNSQVPALLNNLLGLLS